MSEWFRFVILCLVTARVSRMLMLDNGPFGVFLWVRSNLGVEAGRFQAGNRVELFNCPWCMSVNVASVVCWCAGGQSLEWWVYESLAASFVSAWLILKTHNPA